jgi:hypothetical protein
LDTPYYVVPRDQMDENLIQNYWFSLFEDRLYVSLTDTEP